jgi:hypothetical protein
MAGTHPLRLMHLARRALRSLAPLALVLLPAVTEAQTREAPVGWWTGTSRCVRGKPLCKDERVMWRLERAGPDSGGATPLQLSTSKVVGGEEEAAAVLTCTYLPARDAVHCGMPPQGEWRVRRAGSELRGGLWQDGKGQVRSVRLRPQARVSATG